MARISEITKRIALGCLPLAALVMLTPKPQASGQFGIFTTVLGTVTGMGSSITQFNTDTAQIQLLQKQVLYPVQDFNNIQSNATSVVNAYRGWMNSVFGLNLASAQTTSGQALERQMLSGFTNTNPSAQMGSLFTNAYGPDASAGDSDSCTSNRRRRRQRAGLHANVCNGGCSRGVDGAGR